jgi:hypothetical protein
MTTADYTPGDELTVQLASLTGKVKKLRVVFRQVRERDGSLECWDPEAGHVRNFRPEAVALKHRKKKVYGNNGEEK